MQRPRRLAALAATLLSAAALAGCGLGAGESEGGGAGVLVTQDWGSRVVAAKIVQNVPSSDTVMRLLQRSFDVETRYGGGFVQSIDGLEGSRGGQVDWFYFVNGILADKGASEVDVHGGDAIWWDRHDWSATGETPAVVGAFPEPFLHGADGRRFPVVLSCADGADAACDTVSQRLDAIGIKAARQTLGTQNEGKTLRVVVGPWSVVRGDTALKLIDRGPVRSGVFARFDASGRRLDLLDAHGDSARTLGAGAGLVAAVKLDDEHAPTWAVTGTDEAGVEAAARALETQRLRRRFALATTGPRADAGLPLTRGAG